MTMLLRGALVGACLSCLAAAACGERTDVLGTRAASGAGGESAQGPGGGGAGAGPGSGGGALAGEAGTMASGGQATAGSAGNAGRPGGTGGSSGAAAGGKGGSNASGAAGEGGAGTLGGAGAGGAPTGCPDGCTRSSYAGCTGQVWSCSSGYSYEEFKDGGCNDLGTDLQRFCCPPSFYASCEAPCADAKTLDDCEARSDCHSVFTDPGTCGCASVGCCARFWRCAEGATATCKDPGLSCTIATPFCENPAYVLSYANGCYEGCVQPKDCAP